MSHATPQQEEAIAARGNVLVVAGAGAGKTRTLVERCAAWLLDPQNPGSLDQVLMVTFTEAAAAEMRQRLRAKLEEVNATTPTPHVAEQLALLDTALICTLHSFCYRLAREHFYELGLDPQVVVLTEERARTLERQALDLTLQNIYSSDTPAAKEIQKAIQSQGGDSDAAARDLVLRVHHYAQTLRDPAAWFAGQIKMFDKAGPGQWREWLAEALEDRRQAWLALAKRLPSENKAAAEIAGLLAGLPRICGMAELTAALDAICNTGLNSKAAWREPLKDILDEAEFLRTLCAPATPAENDPLAEDWRWSARSVLALLDLTRQFAENYQSIKREAGGIDFHDLEQFALRLLLREPSPTAAHWQAKLRLIFVDEYQDINAAQDAIIQALGREGPTANRFLVGDLKQSIYRFRLADPRIFLHCWQAWRKGEGGRVIPLSDNFRSHEGILNFVNTVFESLMRAETGGIEYDAEARLRFGNAGERVAQKAGGNAPPRVELHLRRTGRKEEEGDDTGTEAGVSRTETEKEARLVGLRLTALKGSKIELMGRPAREAGWSDMVILLRSPRRRAETYVKVFERMGIPLAAAGGGFYDSMEVRDLLNLLQVLDNPLQDLPLIAVLRSPLAGFTPEALAEVRLAQRKGRFWHALLRWHEQNPQHAPARIFLERFHAWRRMSRKSGVSLLLGKILEETGYTDFIPETGPNVSRLLWLTQQFDGFRGEGLYRFLQFVEAQQENDAEMEPAQQPMREAVRLMSIHQSKGQEFPIVALADLGKAINLEDLRRRVILDEELGLCPMVQAPGRRQFYPSLPHWLAQRRQKQEIFGEELRLLYVAMTRAAEHLLLFGSASDNTISKKWPAQADGIMEGRKYMDWLGTWLVKHIGAEGLAKSGANSLLAWQVYDEESAPEVQAGVAAGQPREVGSDLELLRRGAPLAEWRYPFEAATQRAAKTSVSALRRDMPEQEEEAQPLFAFGAGLGAEKQGAISSSEIGSAHHAFLEAISLDDPGNPARLLEEAARLLQAGLLSESQAGCLDLDALAAFWQSETGRELLARRSFIRRELPFTARFSPEELGQPIGAGEFILVQGIVDLAVVMPNEIWLLDFKTDRFPEQELGAKVDLYRLQLSLYARAIARTYARPVTKTWLHFFTIRRTVPLKIAP